MGLPQTDGNDANPDALSAIVKASESFSIVASQDIVDVKGIKLWAKGQPVSHALQQRLLERKLQQPLEVCLAAEDGATLFRLREDLRALLETDTPLAQVLRPWADLLLEQVKHLPLHSVAQLLLTAALATRPNTLPHAVMGMALAGAIMASRKPATADVRLAMLGGLLHDIGEVYIQPRYLDCSAQLDLIGHKHLVVHPRVAQMLLKTTTDYPDALCRAIGEHHERLDGSGYPARLVGEQISSLGRVLAVAEATLGILRSPYAPFVRAGFALRVVPGEFDLQWSGLICSAARTAEGAPDQVLGVEATPGLSLAQIDQRIEQAHRLAVELQDQRRGQPMLNIVDTVLHRLDRLRVAWNALGSWGLGSYALSPREQIELEMASSELQFRLRSLQRESLLLGERLGEDDMARLEPLWRGLIEEEDETDDSLNALTAV